ncbi:MAG: DHHA1 domain-containing protein [Thermoanaerobacteraceae bacterium]
MQLHIFRQKSVYSEAVYFFLVLRFEALNKKRLELVNQYLSQVEDNKNKFLIYIFKNCPKGITGLIEGHAAEKYEKHVMVSSVDNNGKAVSSVRTYGEFNLMEVFKYVSKHIDMSFGVHKSAVGVSYNIKDLKKVQDLLTNTQKKIRLKKK